MRVVAINAKVTFVIWLLEFLAAFSIIIVWVFVVGSTSFVTLTNSMVWMHVLIPYTFLMNTSYNKGRIIDEGWKTVITNSFFDVKNCFSRKTRVRNIPMLKNWSSVKDSHKTKLIRQQSQKQISSSKLEDNKSSSFVQQCKSDYRNVSKISIIATSEYDIPSPGNQTLWQIEDLEPTSSNNQIPSNYLQSRNNNLIGKNVSTDAEEENESQLSKAMSSRVTVGAEILSKMFENLNYEAAYIHYFKQLVDYEEIVKRKDQLQECDFKAVPFFDFKPLRNAKVKRSHKLIQNDFTKKNEKTTHEYKCDDQNHCQNEAPLNINSSVEYIIRAQLRRDMLKHYHKHCDEESRYHFFIDSLIELEESFIEC